MEPRGYLGSFRFPKEIGTELFPFRIEKFLLDSASCKCKDYFISFFFAVDKSGEIL